MTLWPLDDAPAREFMEEFYSVRLRRENDPADALATVQRSWAASPDPRRAAAHAWAPYVLVQNGR